MEKTYERQSDLRETREAVEDFLAGRISAEELHIKTWGARPHLRRCEHLKSPAAQHQLAEV